ncbi:MAG: hypothetical protein K2M73_10460 [Lachnospiraceae bacterium]|nr:hypothetical protein [Lachnospiraceae bacterium]
MSKLYDISAKITNELPTMRITDEIIVTVNNRKNNILGIQAMVKESEKKTKESGEDLEEMELMNKALKLLVGEKKTEEINDLDLPINEYKYVYTSIMKLAQGIEPDTPIPTE